MTNADYIAFLVVYWFTVPNLVTWAFLVVGGDRL